MSFSVECCSRTQHSCQLPFFQICCSNAIFSESPSLKKWLFLEESNSLLRFPAHHIMSGFLKLKSVNILCWTFFYRGLSIHCWVGCTPVLYPQNVRSISLAVTTKYISEHCQCRPGARFPPPTPVHDCCSALLSPKHLPSSKVINFIQQQILTQCLIYARHDSRDRR